MRVLKGCRARQVGGLTLLAPSRPTSRHCGQPGAGLPQAYTKAGELSLVGVLKGAGAGTRGSASVDTWGSGMGQAGGPGGVQTSLRRECSGVGRAGQEYG